MQIPERFQPSRTKLKPRIIEGSIIGYANSDKIIRVYVLFKHNIVVLCHYQFSSSREEYDSLLLVSMERQLLSEVTTATPLLEPYLR